MRKIARKEIFGVKPYVPGKPIEEVRREFNLKDVIKMASNENALRPSRKALRAAKRALSSINRYPDGGCFYLKKALALKLGVKPYNIVVGNGSDEIVVLALRAFVKKGDEVIIAKPTFLVYEIASQIHGAKMKFAPLKDYRYDIRGMVKLISKRTKLIFIANPDNPSGTYVNKKDIEYLIRKTPKKTILFFDEAYYEFAKSVKDYPETIPNIRSTCASKNIIIARSFSKAYSLAGLRIGYGITKKEIAECLDRVREPFNVNSIAQASALAALDDKGHVKMAIRLMEKGRTFLTQEFDKLGLKYVPSVTNFILVKLGKDSKPIYKKLLKKGVIVREMSPWKLKNSIRVTVGTMRENKRFIKALKEVL